MEGANTEGNCKGKTQSFWIFQASPSHNTSRSNHEKARVSFPQTQNSTRTHFKQAQSFATYHTGVSFPAFQTAAHFDSAAHGSLQQRNNPHRWLEAVPQKP